MEQRLCAINDTGSSDSPIVTILLIFEEKVDPGSATLRYKRQRKKCSTREVVQKVFKRVISGLG
jgi:hypothetical protein